jgi:signal transduction histidine kinase
MPKAFSKEKLLRELGFMLFFGILSYLLGYVYFYTPGVEGGSSNLIEIPLLISTFYLYNPLSLIGVCFIMSFVTPEDGSYWSTFLMHIFPLIISWYSVRFMRKRIKNSILLGASWGIYTILHYCLLLLPLLVITNHLFGLNLDHSFVELYHQMFAQVTFEMASTVLTTSLFLVLITAYNELKQHKNNLEQLVESRTKDLKEANKELEKNIATKDKLFRIIGHDLRTPIGQIIQFTDLLQEGYKEMPEKDFIELAQMLKESSTQGMQLLENLLEWARTQTDSIQVELKPFNLHNLVEDSIQLLGKDANFKEIQIVNHIDPDFRIHSDANILHTILRNLISNAIKFTPTAGKIQIRAVKIEHEMILSVEDNGEGIPQQDLPKIFDLGSKYSTQGTNQEKGTGVGLILCKELIEQLNGKIWVESEEGKGSTFFLKIPQL